MKLLGKALFSGLVFACATALHAQSVVFIAGTGVAEAFSISVAKSMEAAAQSLGMKLEIRHSERQPPMALAIAQEIVNRPANQRPDYAVIANELGTGPELLRIFNEAGIKTLMAFGGIHSPEDTALTGIAREKYKFWLGTLEPNPEEAGYFTARDLIRKAREAKLQDRSGRLNMLAIGGDKSTTTSVLRNEGMRRAIQEAGDVNLLQEISAGFNQQKAMAQATVLFQRYPQANLIWAGNDLMAFGAMQAWQVRGGQPGKDALFSGINTSLEAMSMIRDGRLAALAGGHFITGAFAMVMIYDYHHHRDFKDDEGLNLNKSVFMSFGPKDAEAYMTRFGQNQFASIDFRRFSKVLNPGLKRYDFRFQQVFR